MPADEREFRAILMKRVILVLGITLIAPCLLCGVLGIFEFVSPREDRLYEITHLTDTSTTVERSDFSQTVFAEALSRGRQHYSAKRYQKAVSHFTDARTMAANGQNMEAVLMASHELARALYQIDDLERSASVWRDVLSIANTVDGELRAMRWTAKLGLARIHVRREEYAAAESLCLQTLREVDKTGDDAGKLTEPVLVFLIGSVYSQTGELEKAMQFVKAPDAPDTPLLPTDTVEYGSILASVGQQLREKGEIEKARRYLLRATFILERRNTKWLHLRLLAVNLLNLAEIERWMGNTDVARDLYERALPCFESAPDRKSEHLATFLHRTADFYRELGEHDKSELLFQRCESILESLDKPWSHFELHYNLALHHAQMGRLDRAKELLESVLAGLRQNGQADSWVRMYVLGSLAEIHRRAGEVDKAIELAELVLAECEVSREGSEPAIAAALTLSGVFLEQDDLSRAESLLSNVLTSLFVSGETKYRRIALNNLGKIFDAQGKSEEAERVLLEALAISERTYGPESRAAADCCFSVAEHFAARGNNVPAVEYFDRARRLRHRQVDRTLSTLSRLEQIRFRAEDRHLLSAALTLALKNPRDSDTVASSAEWVLNGRAVVQDILFQQSLDAKRPESDEIKHARTQLAIKRSMLENETWMSGLDSNEEPGVRDERTRTLRGEIVELEEQIRRLVEFSVSQSRWITLTDVRQMLPRNSVLFSFLRMVTVFDFTGEGAEPRPAHYVAWVIPGDPGDSTSIVDLGEARRIDSAIYDIRQLVQTAPQRIALVGHVAAEREYRKSLRRLSDLLLQPLWGKIGGKQHWIVSPDSQLWFVPWGALQSADESYAVETYEISCVASIRRMVHDRGESSAVGPAVVVADPDYEGAVVGVEVGEALALDRETRQWTRLPGTAREAEAVRDSLRRMTGKDPLLYTESEASEQTLRSVKRPACLILATHAFWEGPRKATLKGTSPFHSRGLIPLSTTGPAASDLILTHRESGERFTVDGLSLIIQDPLTLCGLVLAGANNPRTRAGNNDGIFTGLEAAELDLRGTRIVVLSACESGIGRATSGEGVFGLREAFHVAGAHSVISSLWRIPDVETAELMKMFFDGLASGKDTPCALRAAQMHMIDELRSRHGTAHPFYWAAFTASTDEGVSGRTAN